MADDDPQVEGQDLGAVIANELSSAQAYGQSDLTEKRSLALEYMRGEMRDLPARSGGSEQTSRDVADTISWMLPGIVRVFTASDQMVTYDQVREEDDRWSQEATEYTNYTFFRENEGYSILYNATRDSLQMGDGVVSCYWEAAETETKTFSNMSGVELATKMEDEGWQPVSYRQGKPQETDDGEGNTIQLPTLTVKMQRTERPGRICDHTHKPENLLLNVLATSTDDARFVAYLHDDKTRSDLVQMAGPYEWDTDVIDDLPAYARMVDINQVNASRFGDRPVITSTSPLHSADLIDLYEIYMKADMDGDGIAELIQVWYAGNAGQGEILGWEEWDDDIPFTTIPCYPVPHRWDSESVFDRIADVQRVKTTLLRQGLDNTYAVNMPMREVEAGSVLNPDILVHHKFSGLIWKKAGSAPIIPHVIPYIADKAFAAMEYMDQIIAKRTGVSKTTMALDPETLQNQTATANQNEHDAGYSQIELVARNQAELGWKRHFKKRLKLAVKYEQVRKIPSRDGDPEQGQAEMGPDGQPVPPKPGKFREINPGQWDPAMAVAINVGLGTGSRDRDMAMLNQIQQNQMVMAQMLGAHGMTAKAIEFIPKIRNTAVKMAESSGLKNPDEYYPDFTEDDVKAAIEQANQPPPPDPAIQLEQMKGQTAMQLEQVKGQVATQNKQVDAQVDQHAAELKAQGEVAKNQAELDADLTTKAADRQNALDIENARIAGELEKQNREIAYKMWEAELQANLQRESMANAAQMAKDKPEPGASKGAD